MNTFSKIIKNLFLYEPKSNYEFTLPESNLEDAKEKKNPPSLSLPDDTNIFPNLDDNYNYLKSKYNFLINSDIIFISSIIGIL